MVETTVGGRRGARLLGAICLAGFLLVGSSGCSYLRGDQVEVVGDDSAMDEAFDRVRDSRQPARLGDVVDQANLPFGVWDRMYRFPASKDGEEIDSVLGADVRWVGLPGGSDGYVQVFMREGTVAYAFVDHVPSSGVGSGRYATPDSMVTPVELQRKKATAPEMETYWALEVEEAG
ncbi:hypothetical protein [Nocardia carnea]|uniref:hypothetical protein n=1 Tax=Nocardia carnea TaxID=37328 RepID=UPI0024559F09|nr:hypothetical protein [Nocardia carnea]